MYCQNYSKINKATEMTRNTKFADKMEEWDFKVLQKLNEDAHIMIDLAQLPVKQCADASGVTALGSKLLIELKARSEDILKYGDLFIESKKVAYLLLKWLSEGFIPLYINFIGDTIGDYPKKIIIFKMHKLTDWEFYPKVKTWTELYQKYEYNERFGLKIKDAAIYELVDGKYTLRKWSNDKQQKTI